MFFSLYTFSCLLGVFIILRLAAVCNPHNHWQAMLIHHYRHSLEQPAAACLRYPDPGIPNIRPVSCNSTGYEASEPNMWSSSISDMVRLSKRLGYMTVD